MSREVHKEAWKCLLEKYNMSDKLPTGLIVNLMVEFAKREVENNSPLPSINKWLLLPGKGGDWADYEAACDNNCELKFDDGSICRFDDTPWPFAVTTHYRHP